MLSTKKLNFLKYVSHLISAVQNIYSNADHAVAAPIEMVDLKKPGLPQEWLISRCPPLRGRGGRLFGSPSRRVRVAALFEQCWLAP
jgi:hypothetical protein